MLRIQWVRLALVALVVAVPATALLGCTVKTTFAAGPTLALTSNALLVAPVRPVAVAVSV